MYYSIYTLSCFSITHKTNYHATLFNMINITFMHADTIHPKRLTRDTFDQLIHSLGIKPMILATVLVVTRCTGIKLMKKNTSLLTNLIFWPACLHSL